MAGKVTLIGAGPGDPGLMTIKGRELLEGAEVVVYDRLVSKDILKLIPTSAEKIDAGKESSNHKIPQEEINKILLNKALEGKNVVRLKGGDSFLFGRGGEELELLYENKIDFQVVPGITSALAVPTYGGIPVTHRDFASSVHIITGHQKKNESLKIDFKSCVNCGGTLVFLMGVANLDAIMKGLIENGMSSNMPCAVIEQGTTASQRKIVATISTITELAAKNNIKSPSIIIVGQVCSLSDKFDWFDNLPLKGKKIVVTRPKERAGSLCHKLKSLGADVIEYPCIETISLMDNDLTKKVVEKINEHNIIAFTSPSGVKIFFEALKKIGKDLRVFGNKKIAVIGSATGEEIEKYGIIPDFLPLTYDGKNLGKLIAENANNEKVLLLRAREGSREITDELKASNICYEDMAIYYTDYIGDTASEYYENIKNGAVDFVTFTSASTVKAFNKLFNSKEYYFTALCIGEKTGKEAEALGIKTIVSPEATIDSMVETLAMEVKKCL